MVKEVCLLSLEQAGIVVAEASGVFYWSLARSESGGTTLDTKRRAQGYFVPISNDPPQDQPELSLVPRLNELAGGVHELTPSLARQLDDLLYEVSSSDVISVDVLRLKESAAGWVYLNIMAQGEFSYLTDFGGQGQAPLQGVLIWPCRAG